MGIPLAAVFLAGIVVERALKVSHWLPSPIESLPVKCPYIEECPREIDEKWHERYCISTIHLKCSRYKTKQPHNTPSEWEETKESKK